MGANKELRFTQNDLAKIQDKTRATLGEVGNPLLANKIKMKEKQIKFMESGNFGLTEFAYIQRTHGGTFKDVGETAKRLEEIARFERSQIGKVAVRKPNVDAFRPLTKPKL